MYASFDVRRLSFLLQISQTLFAAVVAACTASSLQKVFVPLDFSPDRYAAHAHSDENAIDYDSNGAPIFTPRSYEPSPPHKYEEHPLPPQPYVYKYGVKDVHTGTSFDKHEEKDDRGNLQGSYRVNLPDGRVQVVSYRATPEGGYKAEVTYEGEPIYPPEPAGGYGNTYRKKYAPTY